MARHGMPHATQVDPEVDPAPAQGAVDWSSYPAPADPTQGNTPGAQAPAPLQPAPVAPEEPSNEDRPPIDNPDAVWADYPTKKTPIEQVYGNVAHIDPERAAKVIGIAQRTGQPASFIDNHLDMIQKAEAAPPTTLFAKVTAQYPETAKFLTQPENMARAHDDIPNLATHEHLIQGASATHSIADAFSAGWQGSSLGMLIDQGTPNISMGEGADWKERLAAQAGGLLGDFPAMAAGGIAGGPAGAFAAPAFLRQAMTEMYNRGQLKDMGDVAGAYWRIIKGTAVQGGIGALTGGAGRLAGVVTKESLAPLAAELGTMTTAGAATEGRLPTRQDFIDNLLVMGAMHAAGALPGTAAGKYNDYVQGKKAEASKNFLMAFTDTAEGSKLRTRDPDLYAAHIEEVTKNGPVKDAYLPVTAIETYFQSKGIDPKSAMDELGVGQDFEDARKIGEDATVKIPLSTLASKVSPEHIRALSDDIKFDPEGLTPREAKAKASDEAEALKAVEAEHEAQAQTTEQAQAKAESATRVRQAFEDTLRAHGMSEEEIQANAPAHEAVLRRFAERAQMGGMSPEDLADQFRLTMRRLSDEQARIADRQQFDPDVLGRMRGEIEAGGLEQGGLTKDQEGNVTGRYGRHSTFPEYFKNKGYTKKNVLSAIDRALQDPMRLSDKQHAMLADLYNSSGHAEAEAAAMAQEPFLQRRPVPLSIDTHPDGTRIARRESGQSKRSFLRQTAEHFPDVDSPLLEGSTIEEVRANALARLEEWNRNPGASPAFGGQVVHVDEHSINHILSSTRNEADSLHRLRRFGRALTILEHAPFLTATREEPNGTKFHELTGRFPDGEIDQAVVIDKNGKKLLSVFKKEKVATQFSEGWPAPDSSIPESGSEGTGSGSQLNQVDSDKPQGRMQIRTSGSERSFHIDLLSAANKSTLPHELAHYYLEVMRDIAARADASPEIKDDFQKLLKWFQVEKGEDIQTDHHEQFARGWEQYLAEGKAPVPELQGAFDRFKDWIVSVYKQIKNIPGVKINDEVRGVFDRLLASKDAINEAKRETGITDEVPADASPEAQTRIRTLQERARSMAENALLKEQMKELDAKHTEFLAKERERVTAQAESQVAELPLYKAMDEAVESIGKDRQAGTIAEKFLGGKLKNNEAAQFEALAEVHGFPDGEDMAQHMILAEEGKLRGKEIQARVEAGMAQHADLKDSAAIRTEALKAIHNDRMAELLALERATYQDLARKKDVGAEATKRNRLEAKIAAQSAKAQAQEILAKKPVDEAGKSSAYVTAERNAAVKVAKALASGDYEKAATAKREQMLNHALASEAMANAERAEKAFDFLKKFQSRGRDLLDMPYGFNRQIDQLLTRFGLPGNAPDESAAMTAVARDMLEKGEDPAEIANRTGLAQDAQGGFVPETLSQFTERVNNSYFAFSLPESVRTLTARAPGDIKMSELMDLKTAVHVMSSIGKKFDRFLSEFIQIDMQKAGLEFRQSIAKNFGVSFAQDMLPGSRHATELAETLSMISRLPGAFDRQLDTILTTCHKFDGLKEGPAKNYIYRPFADAENRKLQRTRQVMEELDGIFAKHYTQDEFASYKEKRVTVDGRTFTKEEILAMALNWGNEGNRSRLTRQFNNSPTAVEHIFDASLDKKDWDFAQDIWKHIDQYWPDIVKLEMDANGVTPRKVENTSFENRHGKYEGGYYPIAYDFEKSADAYRNAQDKDALFKQYSTAKAATDQGHTEARVSFVNRPLRLSLDVLRNHHEDVIHDLEFRRAVIDASRFLNQRDVKGGIVDAVGVKGYTAITDWLKSVAGGSSEPLGYLDKFSRWFRFRTTFFNLGYRLVSAPKIAIENMVNVSSELGVSGAARAVKDYYTGDSGMHELVVNKSEFMKQRANHLDRDISDINKKWQGTSQSGFRRYAFFVHAYLDQGMSFPLWADQYKRAIAEHGDERLAVHQADESVKRTFMSGGEIDQAAIMRGSEKQKALTTAYGYHSMMWNRFSMAKYEASQEWDKGNPMAAAAIAARAGIYQFFLPGLVGGLTSAFLRNSQTTSEDDQQKRLVARMIEEGTPMKFIPILRDIGPYFVKKAMGEHVGALHVTPLEEAAQTLLDPVANVTQAAFGGHVDPKLAEHSINAVSLLAGVPKQFNDVVFNFIDWSENNGEAAWRDVITRRTKK